MNIWQIALLGIICVGIMALLREYKSPLVLMPAVAFGIVIFSDILPQVAEILALFNDLSEQAGINNLYLAGIFKVIGIAYVGEFAAQICRDGGSGAVAAKIELAGKIIIMTLMLPILRAIMTTIIALL